MKASLTALSSLLQTSVVEIKFKRRKPKPGFPDTRRMLCTNCRVILDSYEARQALKYTPTKQPPKFNPAAKNIVIAWDIFVQDYRCISADNLEIVAIIPGDDTFWEYFSDRLSKMTAGEKTGFMKS